MLMCWVSLESQPQLAVKVPCLLALSEEESQPQLAVKVPCLLALSEGELPLR